MSEHIKEPLPIRIMKITVKAIGLTLVFGTIIFFLWRAFISTIIPGEVNGLAVNPQVHAAWLAATQAGEELTYFTQVQNETTTAEHNYSYFTAKNVAFIEDANQIQLLFRYNNATIRSLMKDYNLPEVPDRALDLYDITLYVAYDLTPGDVTDNAGNDPESVKFVRYYPTATEPAQTLMYNYRRLTFDGVDMNVTENPVLAVYVDIYYKEDIDYGKDPYGTLCIYDYLTEREYRELGKNELKALKDYN
ncbi:MAG: hypothetical protein IJA91_03075 [Clostridia bacterium]|nr:hypothetical protein [Clostridia bacterium]